MDWDDNFQDIVDKLNAAALEVKDLQDQLAEQERLIEAVALALDGLPITGERTGPRSAKYLDFPDQIKRLRAQLAHARRTLEFIASKSRCSCWTRQRLWIGCPAYHTVRSDDSIEWCLTCVANAALAWITEKVKNGI